MTKTKPAQLHAFARVRELTRNSATLEGSGQIFGDYKHKATERECADEHLKETDLRIKAAASCERNKWPNHVDRAVKARALAGPKEKYLKKIAVRKGNTGFGYVVEADDFLRIFTSALVSYKTNPYMAI